MIPPSSLLLVLHRPEQIDLAQAHVCDDGLFPARPDQPRQRPLVSVKSKSDKAGLVEALWGVERVYSTKPLSLLAGTHLSPGWGPHMRRVP